MNGFKEGYMFVFTLGPGKGKLRAGRTILNIELCKFIRNWTPFYLQILQPTHKSFLCWCVITLCISLLLNWTFSFLKSTPNRNIFLKWIIARWTTSSRLKNKMMLPLYIRVYIHQTHVSLSKKQNSLEPTVTIPIYRQTKCPSSNQANLFVHRPTPPPPTPHIHYVIIY